MFERLTPEAREVVRRSQSEARRLGHAWVGCEHLLLGICEAGGPAAALLRHEGAGPEEVERAITALLGGCPGDGDERAALAALGIDIDEVRTRVEATFGAGALDLVAGDARRSRRCGRGLLRRRAGPPTGRLPPFTPRAKRCLERSLRESLRLNHRSVGVDHMALALLAHDDTVAWAVLARLGVRPDEARRSIEERLRRAA